MSQQRTFPVQKLFQGTRNQWGGDAASGGIYEVDGTVVVLGVSDTVTCQIWSGTAGDSADFSVTSGTPTAEGSAITINDLGDAGADPPEPAIITLVIEPDDADDVPVGSRRMRFLVTRSSAPSSPYVIAEGVVNVIAGPT